MDNDLVFSCLHWSPLFITVFITLVSPYALKRIKKSIHSQQHKACRHRTLVSNPNCCCWNTRGKKSCNLSNFQPFVYRMVPWAWWLNKHTFGILVWNDSGYVNLTQWWYFFIIFEYILHISTPHIMIFCFPLPYFPLSTSALFFA